MSQPHLVLILGGIFGLRIRINYAPVDCHDSTSYMVIEIWALEHGCSVCGSTCRNKEDELISPSCAGQVQRCSLCRWYRSLFALRPTEPVLAMCKQSLD
jgi:hypothetical protein